MAAFLAHLPPDVSIVSCHSLHGPNVDTKDQPLAIIRQRGPDSAVELVARILACFKSKIVHLSAKEHDDITADTQAVTHAAFLSMGTAWRANNQFPWEIGTYVGGIENVKINVMLRIYSNKWHVYAGLAILNPSAKEQIREYAQSVTELFKLMLAGKAEELTARVKTAGNSVFGHRPPGLLLEDEVLDRFSLGNAKSKAEKTANNHLSLLAIVDCWWRLGISPYEHMICSTPVSVVNTAVLCPGSYALLLTGGLFSLDLACGSSLLACAYSRSQLFRLWLGATEYLFRKPALLDEVLKTAIEDNTFRSDDLEFTFAARVGTFLFVIAA